MNRTALASLWPALVGLACSGTEPAVEPPPAAPAATGLRIALQANAHGDIEPCG